MKILNVAFNAEDHHGRLYSVIAEVVFEQGYAPDISFLAGYIDGVTVPVQNLYKLDKQGNMFLTEKAIDEATYERTSEIEFPFDPILPRMEIKCENGHRVVFVDLEKRIAEETICRLKKELHDAWYRLHFVDKYAQLGGDISKQINWASDGLNFAQNKGNAIKEATALLNQLNASSADNEPIKYKITIHSIETI